MKMILLQDQGQEQIREENVFVQKDEAIQWIAAEAAVGSVELVQDQPSMSQWVNFVDQAGGTWASEAELAEI